MLQQHPLIFTQTASIARSLCEGYTWHSLQILVTAPFGSDQRTPKRQRFTLWHQVTTEIMRHNHSIIACSRQIYIWGCYSLRTSHL